MSKHNSLIEFDALHLIAGLEIVRHIARAKTPKKTVTRRVTTREIYDAKTGKIITLRTVTDSYTARGN